MKLTEIWRVNLKPFMKNDNSVYKNQYLLMMDDDINKWNNSIVKKDVSTDYSVDLSSDLWFNTEFYINDVLERHPVKSLNDVIEFCKIKNIKNINFEDFIDSNGLLVGGEKNDLLTNDLELILNYNL